MDKPHESIPDQTIAFEPPTMNVVAPEVPETEPLQPQLEPTQNDLFAEQAPIAYEAPVQEQAMTYDAPVQQTNEPYVPTVVPQPVRKKRSAWVYVWYVTKFVLRIALGIALAAVVLGIGLVGYLTVTEYTPAYAENADRGSVNRSEKIATQELRVVCFNTGFGALGEDADFFMDGGKNVHPSDEETVLENMSGIERFLSDCDADFLLLQEVDTDSKRSYEKNQWLAYERGLENYESRFALNYSCDYVPYPLYDRIGKVNSGIATYSRYDITSATRYSLPNPFSWPVRAANLKRCLLLTRIPIEDSDKELVLINLHLEAYDDGEGKKAQTEQLIALLDAEYAKGNYVIAGGDFNQSFPQSNAYPIVNDEYFVPGELEALRYGWRYAYDDSVPTSRLLNEPFDPNSKNTQYYVIDGFIVSPNITVREVETVDGNFEFTDHNAVILDFTLQ